VNVNSETLVGYPNVPRDNRRPFFSGTADTVVGGYGGAFGWTQGIDFFCNCANNWYDSLQTRFNKRFSDGYAFQVNYTWQKAEGEGGGYFFWDRSIERGVQDWDRTHILNVTLVYELPFGHERQFGSTWSPTMNGILGGWQFNATHTVQSGQPFNVGYADSGSDRDVGPGRPNLIGDPEGPKTRDQWFNVTPIGAEGSAFARPASGAFGDLERNALRGPYYRRTDASVFKHFSLGRGREVEIRIEAVNLFNVVNLANPDSEVGSLSSPRPNAGRISSTAFGGTDPQRNLQFGVKFRF